MEIVSNFSLKKYNTFGIEAKAKQFVAIHSVQDLKTILKENHSQKKFILGGGSNMLLTKDIDALVIHIDLKGKKIIEENEDNSVKDIYTCYDFCTEKYVIDENKMKFEITVYKDEKVDFWLPRIYKVKLQ